VAPICVIFSLTAGLLARRQLAAILADEIHQPNFVRLIRYFLRQQSHPDTKPLVMLDDSELPTFHGKVKVYHSAVATFYAPSDPSGVGGMRREWIRAVPSWRKGPARYDCVFVKTSPDQDDMRDRDVGRVRLFFSFSYRGITYPCALISWMDRVGDGPNEDTGMWVVEPTLYDDDTPYLSVVHLDCLIRAAHLIGITADGKFLAKEVNCHNSLDFFMRFYINKFADHHAFEIAS
jgi:hypothetical protein